jgi:hypothetical protein
MNAYANNHRMKKLMYDGADMRTNGIAVMPSPRRVQSAMLWARGRIQTFMERNLGRIAETRRPWN